ncbi:IQ domain-containing protein K [Diachasma alloeum]|uniref:IQ domain-containing protein K n=1 Tax=Diachasma alloeum TaxID=454923 RepID=UPI0007384CD8|nr:IQ domain-containing protein K [Diachasma alloeum]
MKAFISISAPTLLRHISAGNCENDLCECLERESYGEYSGTEDEIKESFGEISLRGEEKGLETNAKLSLWEEILGEFREERREFEEWEREQEEPGSEKTPCEAVEYLNKEIFPVLLPAMEKMLREARKWNAIEDPKCRFNGLDYLAEYLWNKNPEHPERRFNWTGVFEIPPFRRWLQSNPRPIYPKSWLWTRDEAASVIQRNVRGWIVRKRRDIQELREFWKALAAERAEGGSSIASINLGKIKKKTLNSTISFN